MGCFSWMDCLNPKQKKNIAQGDKAYFLVPEEFCEKYGRSVFEDCYDCYGNFGGYDAYDLLAEFNKDYATEENLIKPVFEQYRDQKYFEAAQERHKKSVERLMDFKNGLSDDEMKQKWGRDYKRVLSE